MKKVLFVLFTIVVFSSCTGPSVVDKVDEKGYNPAPEQIINANESVQASDSLPNETLDTIVL